MPLSLQSWFGLARSPAKLWQALGESQSERVLRLALLIAVLLGVFLRVYLYAIKPSSMWEDEAYWAWKTLTLPVLNQTFRPPGFLLVTKGLATLFGPSELTFRALPFLSGLAGLLATPYVASRLFSSNVTRLVVVTLLAIHPAALTMSVEFKQYGVELGVFVLLLAAFLRYREQASLRTLLLLLLLAWLGFFFSIIIIFLYPALFGVLLWDAFKTRQFRVLAIAGGCAVLCVATILTIYFATWRKLDQGKAEAKWGDKYDVFYVPNEAQSRAAWTLEKYVDVAALPGIGRVRWETTKLSEQALERLGKVDRAAWLVLHVLGLLWLLRQKRFSEIAWLWSPILVMLLFNVFGRWPAGAFRVNSGIVPFTLFLAGFGLDAATALKPPLARPVLAFGALLTLGPSLLMRPDWFDKGTFARPGRFGEVFEVLVASKPRSMRSVLMENSSCRPWTYYSGFDTGLDADMTAQIRKRFRKRCTGGAFAKSLYALARQRTDFWVLLTDRRKDAVADEATKKACEKVERTAVGGGLHVLWHCWPKNEN